MPRGICAHCEERASYKLASFYWAWRWPSGDRRAYVQLLCPDCTTGELLRMHVSQETPSQCVVDQERCQYPDAITVYGTYYIPGRDKDEGCVTFCARHFEIEEEMFIRNARRLPDRGADGAGPRAVTPKEDPWAAVGIEPA